MIFDSQKIKGFFLIVIFCTGVLISCRQIDVFEKNTTIPHYKWDNKYKATGTFSISDTSAPYNIYIVLRHTDSYQYSNIWLNVGLQGPGDTMHFQKVNLVLADDVNGWEGTGMNDIWEVRKLINVWNRSIIKKKGEYHFSISQAMRDNPLPGIMNVGLRVDKVHSSE
jgi:gliding motility-associated lipoprotein GldH